MNAARNRFFSKSSRRYRVAISSAVAPEHREFERSMTTILNAYLAPSSSAGSAICSELTKARLCGEIVLTKSDGGGMTAEAAKAARSTCSFSGPAGGVIGGRFIC